ncbi:MFS transporter [Streptomonospora nanhaiensis]|uniref:DHA2 family multidrug resistance protein-like MFS transporter n=1 Tax=Streptomonospora nanhaiensis TaxID=1323731 RepID=A0A853BR03_9ACTN|nr:MFS transporter [Streptomonospora nanhaiensis]MBV2366989.1 MFS transporter [Streptomonospora nanhaiensis]MBX9390148.1 MFS transporter [Streptomonospora nanhaiensis]NYI97165.1 DHA2 family multidrug resistance protein-like MFS transporter [Streptomonospora nanhaiensis]
MSADPADPAQRATWREWTGLAVLTIPLFMLAADMTVLMLAIPSISADLRPSASQTLWIMHVYGFLIAGFLITMGRLGDRLGRRRLLLTGTAAFGALSAAAAFAPTPEALIAARALQGVAGAALMPSVYSLLRPMFPLRREFTFALAVVVSTFTVGVSLGMPLGGLLLAHFWWGSVFLVNVPLTALLLVLGPLLLPEYRSRASAPLDLASVALSLFAVLGVVYGVQDAAEHGATWPAGGAIVGGAVLGTVFVRRQLRLRDPLLDLRLFANRAFSVSLVGVLVVAIGIMGAEFFLAQYLQSVLGLTPLRAGLLMILPSTVVLVGTMAAPALARRFRPAYVMGAGLLATTAGYASIAVLGDSAGLAVALAALLVAFVGQGPTWTLGSDLIIASSPPERAGSASAMQEVSGELGGALGVALVGSAGAVVYRAGMAESAPAGLPAEVEEAARGSVGGALAAAESLPGATAADLVAAARDAFTAAAQTSFLIAALATGAAAVLVVVLLRHVRAESDAPEAPEPPKPSEPSEPAPDSVPG